MAALDESRSGRSPSMAEHSTVHSSSALLHPFAVRKPAFLSCSLLAPLMPEARGGKWVGDRWSAPEEKFISGCFVCLFAGCGFSVFA